MALERRELNKDGGQTLWKYGKVLVVWKEC
jgi:hypothetical protein